MTNVIKPSLHHISPFPYRKEIVIIQWHPMVWLHQFHADFVFAQDIAVRLLRDLPRHYRFHQFDTRIRVAFVICVEGIDRLWNYFWRIISLIIN